MKNFYLSILALFFAVACQQEAPKPIENPEARKTFEKVYIDTHNGYSEAVSITTSTQKTIYISGQIGEGADLEAQMRDALSQLEAVLLEAGANMKDVVKMNTYIVDYGPESLDIFRGVRKELLGDSDMPASTLVGVEALALPEWLIEIEAVAVVPVR
ncbi:RidA family protein [Robiginitalea aurantiaca]|uniref:RidA family protein n=1 Tax=Robiginitalea aurantiaca TaxID=3056915 RepID=A0ABT7WAM3_9FLAO|nr:RidA family protein [Robiginitalea aurantiaca]MDM9629965.1 RidA family protein [Robiginitalea aurantiaca]